MESMMPKYLVFMSTFYRARALFVVSLLLCSLVLVACGKMPSEVDPPAGVSRDVYSRVYPDSATDPKP